MPTPAENFSASVEAIKDAIATITAAAAPTALIIKRFYVNENDEYWAGQLRSASDLVSGQPRIHAIQIFYEGISQGDEAPILSLDPIVPFGFAWFYEYDAGTDADNSEKRLFKEIAETMYAFAEKSDLDVRPYVMGHGGLNISRMSLKYFGDTPVHIAGGRLEVRLQTRRVR